jgi:GPH family glycoside/pentoside/hexuronide:cation symporter
MIVVLLSMINAISYGIRAGAQTYYFKYYVGDEAMVASFMTWGTACTMLGIVITPFLVKLMDKRRLFIATQVASVLLNLVFYWVQPGQTELLFGLQMLLQFVAAPTMPLMTAMMADVADFSEWRTGRRATGLVFSASTFSGKAGGALGGLVGMLVLSAYGYVANQEQNPQVLEGMRHMMSFYPALGAAAMVASLCFYNLDRQTIERINGSELKRRLNAKG